MRIGTWNLQGRWDARHLELVDALDCDVLLLTEVSERVQLPHHQVHTSADLMAPRRRWAAVASRASLVPLPDPHGASASAEVGGLRFCSSILPWNGCGGRMPFSGSNTAERTAAAVADIESTSPDVWGGDWNHAMSGREVAGAVAGRHSIVEAVSRLGLQVTTGHLPHQIDGLLSIDHVAVPALWDVITAERRSAYVGGVRISDHDAYVVEVEVVVEQAGQDLVSPSRAAG